MPKQPAPPKTDRPTLVGPDAFRAWLRERCNQSSVQEVAAAAGLQPAYLSNILAGRSSIGDSLVARFHYRRRVTITYEPIDEKPPRKP